MEGVSVRRLKDTDLDNILGTVVQGYHVEKARIKRGKCTDSDHYGILLGKSSGGHYVTWEFHLDEDEQVNPYWGHYFMENGEGAVRDFDTRDLHSQPFEVTITETLRKTIRVEAVDRDEAEQMVSDKWKAGEVVLGADDFTGVVEFVAVPIGEEESESQ